MSMPLSVTMGNESLRTRRGAREAPLTEWVSVDRLTGGVGSLIEGTVSPNGADWRSYHKFCIILSVTAPRTSLGEGGFPERPKIV